MEGGRDALPGGQRVDPGGTMCVLEGGVGVAGAGAAKAPAEARHRSREADSFFMTIHHLHPVSHCSACVYQVSPHGWKVPCAVPQFRR